MNTTQPTLLAIETATDACSVAIYYKNHMCMRHEIQPRGHTRLLLPMIEMLLKELGLSLNQIDVLAFGCGPGSFTGVRVATSVIHGLSLALDKPIVRVSTLRILAQGFLRKEAINQVAALFETKMGEIYLGLFKKNEAGIMMAASEESLYLKSELNFLEDAKLLINDQQWHCVNGYPEAQDLAHIARFEFEQGNITPLEEALPLYIQSNYDRVNKR